MPGSTALVHRKVPRTWTANMRSKSAGVRSTKRAWWHEAGVVDQHRDGPERLGLGGDRRHVGLAATRRRRSAGAVRPPPR